MPDGALSMEIARHGLEFVILVAPPMHVPALMLIVAQHVPTMLNLVLKSSMMEMPSVSAWLTGEAFLAHCILAFACLCVAAVALRIPVICAFQTQKVMVPVDANVLLTTMVTIARTG